MSMFDDLKAKADANGDGKISKEDLDSLRDQLPGDQLDKLKNLADQNDDGKIDLNDIKSLDVGDTLRNAKDQLGSLFGE
ncbi:hypothetical protein CR970_03700 [Candidatus Saccharibacteria bacterium]|nr:MAG: hypothetical protein CR970_03700 [Candidatus Saccharibacteria bacterium]